MLATQNGRSKPVRISCRRSEKFKSRSASCPLVRSPIAPELLRREPRDTNYFSPAVLAGGYGNGGARYPQKIGEEFDASLVGAALESRGGERQFEPVAEDPGESILGGAGLHSDREACPLRCVADCNHDGSARPPG